MSSANTDTIIYWRISFFFFNFRNLNKINKFLLAAFVSRMSHLTDPVRDDFLKSKTFLRKSRKHPLLRQWEIIYYKSTCALQIWHFSMSKKKKKKGILMWASIAEIDMLLPRGGLRHNRTRNCIIIRPGGHKKQITLSPSVISDHQHTALHKSLKEFHVPWKRSRSFTRRFSVYHCVLCKGQMLYKTPGREGQTTIDLERPARKNATSCNVCTDGKSLRRRHRKDL